MEDNASQQVVAKQLDMCDRKVILWTSLVKILKVN